MGNKINVIVIGIGHHHADEVMQGLNKHSQYNVLGYYEQDEAVLNKKKDSVLYKKLKQYSYEEILADDTVQALFIEAPAEYQVDYAEKFLSIGLPVHFDKPVGLDYQKTSALFNKMRDRKISFQIGYMYRYNPAVLKMNEYISKGDLGEIYNVEAVMNTENNPEFRTWLSSYPGGSMFILGCHMIDIVYSIMGTPVSVYPFHKKSGKCSVDSFDSCSVIFEYNKGIANIQATCVEVGGYGRRRIIVSGSKNTIEIQPMENPTQMFNYPDRRNPYSSEGKKEILHCESTDRYTYMLDDFASIVRNETSSLYYTPDFEYEINLQKLIIQSAGNLS